MLDSGPACAPAAVVGSNGVSAESLFKTGVFAVSAGDFREFLAEVAILGTWRLEQFPPDVNLFVHGGIP